MQKAVIYGVEALYGRICSYEQKGIEFDRIFNDDKVKYDKHGQFYTFKFQKSNMQLRILYAYIIVDCVPVIIVADFFVKKKDSKRYIRRFDSANALPPAELYDEAVVVYSTR